MNIVTANNFNTDSTLSLKKEIEALPKEPGWQEKAMKLIRKARIDNPEMEISRLKEMGVIDQTSEAQLNTALSPYRIHQVGLKAMIGRALEIKKIYGNSHDVFIHAQSSLWLPVVDLVKEMKKIKNPQEDLHQFKFLRKPSYSQNKTIEVYSKNPDVHDHDLQTRTDLISADGYFFNSEFKESAIHFMSQNSNDPTSDNLRKKVLDDAIRSFYPEISPNRSEFFANNIIEKTNLNRPEIGNLFVFCIPKEKSAQIQYRAHAYARPCDCHPTVEGSTILKQLQQGNLNQETLCSLYDPKPDNPLSRTDHAPQFRLFTPQLTKANDVKIYLLTPDRQIRKEIKQTVKNITQLIHSEQIKIS